MTMATNRGQLLPLTLNLMRWIRHISIIKCNRNGL